MTDMSQDLVTRIDVIPDLAGLTSFEAAIDRAKKKVGELDRAIRHVNNLKPASPYAPKASSAAPSVATTAAIATIGATGANLISRTPLADVVRKESARIAQAATGGIMKGIGGGMGGFLPPPGSGRFGGFLPPPGGGGNWTGGRGGGLSVQGAFSQNPFNRFNTSASNFADPAAPRLNPVTQGIRGAVGGIGRGASALKDHMFSGAGMMGGAGITAVAGMGFNALASSMDGIQMQEAQLSRLPQTVGSAKQAYLDLNAAASEVRADGAAFINIYTNMAVATQKLGMTQKETAEAAQGLAGALKLGGASEVAQKNAIYQMGQALSSGRFAGDEFRSFMEAIGTQATRVAAAFGTDIAGLRKMSEEGKLTPDKVAKAFGKMSAENIEMIKKQGWTWGNFTTVMGNEWDVFLAKANAGNDWMRAMGGIADEILPEVRKVADAAADFWVTLSDESKLAIMVGALGALATAFTMLAIPVLAATWPILAIGAAVGILAEAFINFKGWMDGEGGTIFDELFGSFDEFEKRYPAIAGMLRWLSGEAGKTATDFTKNGFGKAGSDEAGEKAIANVATGKNETGIKELNSLLSVNNEGGRPASFYDLGQAKVPTGGNNISNSGNTTVSVTVQSASEVGQAVSSLRSAIPEMEETGNMAEALGAR